MKHFAVCLFIFLTICTGIPAQTSPRQIPVTREIRVNRYFDFMDSLTASLNTLLPYTVSEHILVRHNPWIIERLASFDYYENKKNGRFIYDQDTLPLLKPGEAIRIPGEKEALSIQDTLNHTLIDLNIPEFMLRIYEFGQLKHVFQVRVGRNADKFLGTVGREVNLRTPVGEGFVYRISRKPIFYKLDSGKRFYTTTRDDGKVTRMPMIPWIDQELDGQRYGAMIHPTTNPSTLGRAYSHGCVGVREWAAWIIYYHAPIGTRVTFRYCLHAKDAEGNDITLRDIYGYGDAKCREVKP
jgi:L,D-transpeptidase ErfK/SrfK